MSVSEARLKSWIPQLDYVIVFGPGIAGGHGGTSAVLVLAVMRFFLAHICPYPWSSLYFFTAVLEI